MIMLVTVLLFIKVTMISKRKTLRQTHQHSQPGSGDDVSGGENIIIIITIISINIIIIISAHNLAVVMM